MINSHQIKVLGCSGGIGGDRRTTSFLVNENILVDAGTGVADLELDGLCKIDHIFVTHAHLDHICSIPLLLDSVIGFREKPIKLYSTSETLNALRNHIFNWEIWPDFCEIPNKEFPLLQLIEISVGIPISIDSLELIAIPAHHTVAAVGFEVRTAKGSLVFTGDTTSCDALWNTLNEIKNLRFLIIESAFDNKEYEIANLSKHFYPDLLLESLSRLKSFPVILVTHLKPGKENEISSELFVKNSQLKIEQLRNGMLITI
jgi:hypothetical protein